jgi:hypothetical protein
LEEVLRYPHIKRLTRLTEGQIAEYIGFLSEVAELVNIGPPIPFATPDADDWNRTSYRVHRSQAHIEPLRALTRPRGLPHKQLLRLIDFYYCQ